MGQGQVGYDETHECFQACLFLQHSYNLNQSLIFGCICNVVLCPCVSTAERQKNDDDKKNNSAQQREGSRGGGGAAAAVANGHGTEKREKPRSLLRGTHCRAAHPNAARGRGREDTMQYSLWN